MINVIIEKLNNEPYLFENAHALSSSWIEVDGVGMSREVSHWLDYELGADVYPTFDDEEGYCYTAKINGITINVTCFYEEG